MKRNYFVIIDITLKPMRKIMTYDNTKLLLASTRTECPNWVLNQFSAQNRFPFSFIRSYHHSIVTTAAFAYNYGNKIIRKLILGCKWPKNRKKWNSIGMLSCLMRLWSWISFLRFAFKQYHFKGLSLWAIRWICSSHSKPALPHQITRI